MRWCSEKTASTQTARTNLDDRDAADRDQDRDEAPAPDDLDDLLDEREVRDVAVNFWKRYRCLEELWTKQPGNVNG